MREGYRGLLALALQHRGLFVAGFLGVVVLSFGLAPFLGANFFPAVDSGQITLHVRAPVGTRIEETAALFDHVEQADPPGDPARRADDRSSTTSACRSAASTSPTATPAASGRRTATSTSRSPSITGRPPATCKALRERLPRAFPGSTFSFLPADIISQILNFGAPAPIDLQVTGPNRDAERGLCAASCCAS